MTVWLCRPGLAHNPCAANTEATLVNPNDTGQTLAATKEGKERVDCFYIYPTVSTEPQANANLTVQPAETAIAIDQASRFSSVCNVWAPMYRQRTFNSFKAGLGSDPGANRIAFQSLLASWRSYLARDNHHRPIVFIGDSQGAAMLIDLLRSAVDPNSALRRQMVVALVIGGNVTTLTAKMAGGSFNHIPVCTRSGERSCVIAYSSFPSTPPPDSLVARPGQGVSLESDQRRRNGVTIACTNPAALSGGPGTLDPYFLSRDVAGSFTTPWVTYPQMYTAICKHSGGTSWLQVTRDSTKADVRLGISEPSGPRFGYHAYDLNLALGNLVADIAKAETSPLRT